MLLKKHCHYPFLKFYTKWSGDGIHNFLLGDFHRKLPRTPSSGTMSSADDLDEREPPSPSEAGIALI